MNLSSLFSSLTDRFLEDTKYVIIPVYPVLLLIGHLEFDPSIRGEQDSLSDLDRHRSESPRGVLEARPSGYDLTELGLLLLLFGEEDPTLGLGHSLRTTDKHSVREWNVPLEVCQHYYIDLINNYSLKFIPSDKF